MKKELFPIAILAGGLATRLHPITQTIPKALMRINDEPFIDHQLRLLHRYGIRHVVLCIGYLGEMIEHHVGNGSRFGMKVQYSYDGTPLLGTGGAIKRALPLLDQSFFVMYGDSYLICDYPAIQAAFEKKPCEGLMTVFHNAGQWDTSNVEYHHGKIMAYEKKQRTPRMHHIDYGVGILTQHIHQHIPNQIHYDLALLYQTLLKKDQLAAYEVKNRFYEVGSFVGIKELEYHLAHEKVVSA